MVPPDLMLSDLERSKVKLRLLGFRRLLSRKGGELGHMLLLKNNRKPYTGMGNSTAPERSKPRFLNLNSMTFVIVCHTREYWAGRVFPCPSDVSY